MYLFWIKETNFCYESQRVLSLEIWWTATKKNAIFYV